MIKTKTALEVKVGDNQYELICSPNSPLGELFDVLTSMRSYVLERLKMAAEADEAKPESEPDVEVV